MLRRTKGLNAAYLPPLASYVVFCRLSELQVWDIAHWGKGPRAVNLAPSHHVSRNPLGCIGKTRCLVTALALE